MAFVRNVLAAFDKCLPLSVTDVLSRCQPSTRNWYLRNMPETQAKIIVAPEKGQHRVQPGDEPGVKLRKG
jgi:hypothetical protein